MKALFVLVSAIAAANALVPPDQSGGGGFNGGGGVIGGAIGISTKPAKCGGSAGDKCPEGMQCIIAAPCDVANATGFCMKQQKQVMCPKIYKPVCDCDGKKYSNECEARGAGARIGKCKDDDGTQPKKPVPLPGTGGIRPLPAHPLIPGWANGSSLTACGTRGAQQCEKGEICVHLPGANCGRTDHPGKCVKKPEICTRDYRPVCGCDGKTYSNSCEAASKGVSIDYNGDCKKEVRPLPGPIVRPKPAPGGNEQLCTYGDWEPVGPCMSGKQRFMRRPLTSSPLVRCRTETKTEECSEQMPPTTSPASGNSTETKCGGFAGFKCPAGMQCIINAPCNVADAMGTCQKLRKDVMCPAVHKPVCDCSGKQYSNMCAAKAAGARMGDGKCKGEGDEPSTNYPPFKTGGPKPLPPVKFGGGSARCIWGPWKSTGDCSAQCEREYSRALIRGDAATCSAPGPKKVACRTGACHLNLPSLSAPGATPVDCEVGNWTEGECGPKCYRIDRRRIKTAPRNGGKRCPALRRRVECADSCVPSARVPVAAPRVNKWSGNTVARLNLNEASTAQGNILKAALRGTLEGGAVLSVDAHALEASKAVVKGQYGVLTMAADGEWEYSPSIHDPVVLALLRYAPLKDTFEVVAKKAQAGAADEVATHLTIAISRPATMA